MNVSNTYTNLSSKAFNIRPQVAPLKALTATIIENPPLLVFRHKDVISSKRPAKYEEREEEEVRRNTPVDPVTVRRGSRETGQLWWQLDHEEGRWRLSGNTS